MSEHEVRQIVALTVQELINENLLKSPKSLRQCKAAEMLSDYYRKGCVNVDISNALAKMGNDYYFDVIPMYFGKCRTIGEIASAYGVDTSTITRNKRRLCLRFYDIIVNT